MAWRHRGATWVTRVIGSGALALCLSVALPHLAVAQPVAPERDQPVSGVLILNQERLLVDTLYGQRIQSEVETASAALAAENRRIEAELSADELELTELRPTLDADAFRELADAFDTRVEAIRAEQEAKARDLTAQAERARQTFFDRAAPILLGIVRARDAAVLMDSRAVLLSSDSVDITDTAILEIDESLGEGGEDPIIMLDPRPGSGLEGAAP